MASGSINEVLSTIESKMKFRTIDSNSLLEGSVYRGEGNSSLVVSLPSERKVIRFRKSDGNSGDEASDERDERGERRVRLTVDFHRNVISGLMGNYSTEPEIVRCNDLKRWMNFHEPNRPANRRHKNVVETFATILPDYTLLPLSLDEKIFVNRSTFSIEIKPKDGCNTEIAGAMCDYCRKQFDKVREGKISRPSSYCPVDLFSSAKTRIFRALSGLVESPQNNLRIFKNGKFIWGEGFDKFELERILAEWFAREKSYEENLRLMFSLIYEALLRPFPKLNSRNDSATVSPNLPADSILETIHRLQKTHCCTVDSVYHIYSSYSKILNDTIVYSSNGIDEFSRRINPEEDSKMPSAREIKLLRDYFVYRISRDCSILMAFREIDSKAICDVPASNVIEISDGRYFLFNNAITDLDPKNVHSIEKHYRQKHVTLRGQNAAKENPTIGDMPNEKICFHQLEKK